MAHAATPPLVQLPPRKPDAHKGDFGTALIVGGSRGMSGAAALAGMAALRGGAGLVRVAVPDACLETVAGYEPSYTTIPLPADASGKLLAIAAEKIIEQSEAATALALGPGLGRSPELDMIVARLYREIQKPMVVDADALNALSTQPEVLSQHAGPRIMTPHPGEFARLLGKKLEGDARQEAAVELAGRGGVVILLKGHRTLITDGTRRAVNATGNPSMATGGAGDVLTGLITALLCQHVEPFAAAQLAAHLHGLAGDLAAADRGEISLIARDIIEYLPRAFEKYRK
jgi:ADP-dependent NAD(P)H-hydrate dehydratase